jgi:hypothetical protein
MPYGHNNVQPQRAVCCHKDEASSTSALDNVDSSVGTGIEINDAAILSRTENEGIGCRLEPPHSSR